MPKFLICPDDPIKNNGVTITGQDARHMAKILRLKAGDTVALTNGHGMDYTGRILESSPKEVTIEILNSQESVSESPLRLTVCSAMLKHQNMDLVIKHLTQLGVHHWIPFFCTRSVPLPDAKALAKRLDRWQAIAAESIKQCQRSRLPEVKNPLTFDQVLEQSASHDIKIAFWEASGTPLDRLSFGAVRPDSRVIVLIGPEGGFTPQEIVEAKAQGFVSCRLGPRILRAETAAISACTLIQHLLGDM